MTRRIICKKNIQEKIIHVILEPTKLVYETKSDKGKLVTFYHDDHTEKFGLSCTTCHKQESCTKCHDVNNVSNGKTKSVTSKKSFEDQHKNCVACHTKNENCNNCHNEKITESFDHSRKTDWVSK